MTVGRLLGTRWLDTYGRVPVLRLTFALAVLGSLLVIFGNAWLAFVGAAVWGVGVSLGFPVGMSASADDPARAGARMSVVATIGYLAFIAGPPALGFLGDHVGVLRSLLAVGTMALLVQLVLESVREPARARGPPRTPQPARDGADRHTPLCAVIVLRANTPGDGSVRADPRVRVSERHDHTSRQERPA